MTTTRRRQGRHQAPVTVSDRLLTGTHQLAYVISSGSSLTKLVHDVVHQVLAQLVVHQ